MRVLFTTLGSGGHVGPLLPFAHALGRAGHEVRVAVRRSTAATVTAAGLSSVELDDAPAGAREAAFAGVPAMGTDAANAHVIGRLFAGLDAPAALPGIEAAIAAWRPDLLVHESMEFAGPLAAERAGLPWARASIALAWSEERFLPFVVAPIAGMRAGLGLAPDPLLRRWAEAPVLSLTPAGLEEPSAPGPAHARRFREDAEPGEPLPDWWPGRDGPLVYVTFGSVAGDLGFHPGLFRAALDALAGLPVRVLLTTGRAHDPADLGPLPANAHAARWVPQAQVAPHAAAMVCHGGFGTVRAGLAAGLPLVVLPLFADQPYNARRVAALGAGIALEGGPDAVHGLAGAVARVLGDPAYAAAAARAAAEARALPPAAAAVEWLRGLAAAAPAAC